VYYRAKPSVNSTGIKKLAKGTSVAVVSGSSKKVTEAQKKTGKKVAYTWVQIVIGEKKYWTKLSCLRQRVDYLAKAAKCADEVYPLGIGCKHASASSLTDIKNKRVINCSGFASTVYQQAGILPTGKVVSHTTAVGGDVTKKKNTIAKAMSGSGNIRAGRCKIVKVGKTYAHMDDSLKKKGIMYIYDSNNSINAGGGYMYSFNNGASELKNGKYTSAKVKSGYCFTHPILYALVPQTV
jgi:hypothetical protein